VEAMTANTNNADRTEAEEIKHELAEKLPEEGRKKIKVTVNENGAHVKVLYDTTAFVYLSKWELSGWELSYICNKLNTQELEITFLSTIKP